jgi:LysM repeat protein
MFAQSFPQLRGDWDKYDAYVVRHGERFEDIATVHGLSSYKLRKLNELTTEAEIRGGMYLVVPKVSAEAKKANLAAAKKNLYASGVSGKDGKKLIVPVPDPDFRVKGKKRVFYRVVSGDTQYGIALAFGVDRHSLAAWNGLDAEAHLTSRMILQVWVSKSFDPKPGKVKLLDSRKLQIVKVGTPEHLDESEERMGRKRIVYTAKKRETYESIAKKYGLTSRDLARINSKPHSTTLQAGETAIVYDVVDRKASDRAAEQAKAKARATGKSKRPSKRKPRKKKKKKGKTKSATPVKAPVKTAKPEPAPAAKPEPKVKAAAEAKPKAAEAKPKATAKPEPTETAKSGEGDSAAKSAPKAD